MNNTERLAKLQQAEKLIREVEFSYEHGAHTRYELYRGVVEAFGIAGIFTKVIVRLKELVREENREGRK